MGATTFGGYFLNLFFLVRLYHRSQGWIKTPHLGTNGIIISPKEVLPSFGAERSFRLFQQIVGTGAPHGVTLDLSKTRLILWRVLGLRRRHGVCRLISRGLSRGRR